jgi:hypothetical protein
MAAFVDRSGSGEESATMKGWAATRPSACWRCTGARDVVVLRRQHHHEVVCIVETGLLGISTLAHVSMSSFTPGR